MITLEAKNCQRHMKQCLSLHLPMNKDEERHKAVGAKARIQSKQEKKNKPNNRSEKLGNHFHTQTIPSKLGYIGSTEARAESI